MREINFVLLGAIGGAAAVYATLTFSHAEVYLPDLSISDAATLISGFGGALLGAIAGGAVSAWLAKASADRAKAAENEARVSREAVHCLSVMLKAQEIADGCYTQRKYILNGLKLAEEKGAAHLPKWQFVQQQASAPVNAPTFTSEELVPFIKGKKPELIDRCRLASRRYAVLEATIDLYGSKRAALQDLLVPYSTALPGGQIVTSLPASGTVDYKKASLMILELESLLQDIIKTVNEDFAVAKQLCDDVSSAIQEMYGSQALGKLMLIED
ncbi:hypothetical protein [Nostoc phage Nsp-JY10]